MDCNIFVDIETLDTKVTAAVIAIGAVEFDPRTGNIIDEFYTEVSVKNAINYGTVSWDTLAFWSEQGNKAFNNGVKHLFSTSITGFNLWLYNRKGDNTVMWANGVAFDIAILENKFNLLGIKLPWRYYNVRDYRTIRELVKLKRKEEYKKTDYANIHNALEDCKYCVAQLTTYLKELGL